MANAFYVTSAVAQGMLNGTGLAEALGAAPKLRIFGGAVPANADATPVSPTQLAELLCATTPLASFAAVTNAGRATFGAIANDASADATGTATYWRIYDNAGTTVKCQGTAGVSSADMILNTVSITAGSIVSITAATVDLPLGP